LIEAGPVGLVGAVAHLALGRIVLQAFERHGIAGAVAREAERKGDVTVGHEHGVVHTEARVGPGEHRRGVLALEQAPAHEEPEHGAAERLRELGPVVRGPRHEGAVGPEAAAGGNQMNVRVPVRQRAVGLDAAHDPDRERRLSCQGADRGRDRAGGDAGEIAEE